MTFVDVAVIIPVYNGATTILRALESVLMQSVGVKEIWIIDDCSSDNTVALISDYLQGFTEELPRINILCSDTNCGPGLSRNKAWDLSQAEYIAFLDADDAWAHDKIELQIKSMHNDSDCYLTCHGSFFPRTIKDTKPKMVELKALLFRNTIYTRTVMLRREIPLRFKAGLSEDFDLWIRCLQEGYQIRFLAEPVAYHFKKDFSKAGISGQLIKHEYWEIRRVFAAIRRSPSLILIGIASILFSILKFFRRIFIRLIRTLMRQEA
jgi:glycosyltransferase involved in cell wall biosynthesis